MLFVFLVALGLYWTAHGGLHGRLIEIDHADKAAVDFKVDINTVEVNELITIPEVGQTLAQRIVLDTASTTDLIAQVDDLQACAADWPENAGTTEGLWIAAKSSESGGGSRFIPRTTGCKRKPSRGATS